MSSSPEGTTPKAEDFKCAIGLELMFEPFKTECGHVFERSALNQWIDTKNQPSETGKVAASCPCCRELIGKVTPASADYIEAMFTAYDKEDSWDEVNFDAGEFAKLVSDNQLDTEIGKRYIRLLSSSTAHLSSKAADGAHKDKTAFEVLVSTTQGRNILRANFKIMSQQEQAEAYYVFGKSKITSELMNIKVDGHSIKEHLTNWSLIKSDFEAEEQFSRARIIQFYQSELPKLPSDIVNEIMQDIAYGQRDTVKEKLDKLKQTNPALLQAVLTTKSTIPITSYSGWTISPNTTTLLQAAIKCGDIAVHENYQGAVEIISSYFDKNEALSVSKIDQIKEVFPEGLETHIANQQQNVFNFDSVLAAIDKASKEELEDIVNTPEKTRAQWTIGETDSARRKPEQDLALVEAMNRFRAQFARQALSETIPSLEHFKKAFDKYVSQFNTWTGNDDIKWLKRDLMARQIIGFIQRYLPAHEAQVFAHSLYDVVENKESPTCSFKYKHDYGAVYPLSIGFSGLGFDGFCVGAFVAGGLSWDLDGTCGGRCWKNYVEQKQQTWGTYTETFNACSRDRVPVCNSVIRS